MSCNLSNINQFLLESYVEQINDFLGKESLVIPKNKTVAIGTMEFLGDLCEAINSHKWKVHCVRECPFRKAKEEQ